MNPLSALARAGATRFRQAGLMAVTGYHLPMELLGRLAELAACQEALSGEHGQARAVIITGPPGHTERRVAALVASGHSNPEIAASMFISVKTVEANLTRVYRKLGLRGRVDLARHALESGDS
jgi:DNA-binding CsgD family transcriptional regulator